MKSLIILALTFLAQLCLSGRLSGTANCLKQQNIFVVLDMAIEHDYGSQEEVEKVCSLLVALHRDPCIIVWLYSIIKHRWIKTVTESDVNTFCANYMTIIGKSFVPITIDPIEFSDATSNLTGKYKVDKITFLYAYYYSWHQKHVAIANIAYLQNVENHNVIFYCLTASPTNTFSQTCAKVKEKLPERNLVFLMHIFNGFADRFMRKYFLKTLKNPHIIVMKT